MLIEERPNKMMPSQSAIWLGIVELERISKIFKCRDYSLVVSSMFAMGEGPVSILGIVI